MIFIGWTRYQLLGLSKLEMLLLQKFLNKAIYLSENYNFVCLDRACFTL